jgi:hypothetical protein
VSVFNRICYSKVPSTEAVEKMALELGWNLLVPKDMEAFGKPDEFSYFRGWDVQVGEQFYRVGLTQRGVAGSLAEQFPAFAKGTVTSCTLVLGDEGCRARCGQRDARAGRQGAGLKRRRGWRDDHHHLGRRQ